MVSLSQGQWTEAVFALAFVSLYTVASGQVFSLGSCPQVKVKEDFDVGKYVGRWYEHARYPTVFQFGGRCVAADYQPIPKEPKISVVNSMTSLFGNKDNISGSARLEDPSKTEAKLLVTFKGMPKEGQYWVLDTDYDTYSVVYACSQFSPLLNFKFVWQLTREPEVTEEEEKRMDRVLDDQGISRTLLFKTTQKGCRYPSTA